LLSTNLAVCLVLDITQQTTVAYASIRSELREAGTPIPSNDAWIAALCRQHSIEWPFDKVKTCAALICNQAAQRNSNA
jgi:predicted nucleic acid-binding protein